MDERWDQPTEEKTLELLEDLKKDKPEYFHTHKRSVLGLVVNRRGNFVSIQTDGSEIIEVDLEQVKSAKMYHKIEFHLC